MTKYVFDTRWLLLVLTDYLIRVVLKPIRERESNPQNHVYKFHLVRLGLANACS
jgi:hypothetical protein